MIKFNICIVQLLNLVVFIPISFNVIVLSIINNKRFIKIESEHPIARMINPCGNIERIEIGIIDYLYLYFFDGYGMPKVINISKLNAFRFNYLKIKFNRFTG